MKVSDEKKGTETLREQRTSSQKARTEKEEQEIKMIQRKLAQQYPKAPAQSLYHQAETLYFKDVIKQPVQASQTNPYQGFGFDFKTFWKAALGAFFVFFFFFILFFILWLLFNQ